MFKLPFPHWLATTIVTIESEIRTEDGIDKVLLFTGNAIVDEKAYNSIGSERQKVKMNGRVVIEGDILPDKDVRGFIQFNGRERTISEVQRPRNPDGSVFSTEIGFV